MREKCIKITLVYLKYRLYNLFGHSKGLQTQMNSKIFSDLLEFIKRAHQGKSLNSERTIVIREIPTAALITGE